MFPKISVLLSTYNDELFIYESVNSILNQSFKDFEFIIVNDGSSDSTLAILKKFDDDRIKLFSKPNSGMANSWNYGLERCSAKWIARMDGDDVALPNRLEEQLKYANDDVSVIGSNVFIIDNNRKRKKEIKFPSTHMEIINELEEGTSAIAHPTALINAEKIRLVNGYDTKCYIAEDYDLWLRLSCLGKLCNIECSLLELRKHSSNISYAKYFDQALNTLISLSYFKYKKSYSKMSDEEYLKIRDRIKLKMDELDFGKRGEKYTNLTREIKATGIISNLINGNLIDLYFTRNNLIKYKNKLVQLIDEEM